MWASGGAAVGVVTELVNVDAALGVGVVASEVPGDGGGGVLISLLEGDGAGDLGVTTDSCNYAGELARRVVKGGVRCGVAWYRTGKGGEETGEAVKADNPQGCALPG